MTETYPKEIAEAIAKVMAADLYVQKRGKNAFHGYKYATVGDLLDKLQPLMAEAGLVIFQNEVATDLLDGGNVMTTRYEFTLAHTSGAVWPDKPAHTGMSACRNSKGGFDDKAANKCHTAARKYFLLGLFQVPTGEDYRESAHDGDADAGGDAPSPRPLPQLRRTQSAPAPADEQTGAPPSQQPPVNGNGHQAPATIDPERVKARERAIEARDRIERAINEAVMPKGIEHIVKLNAKDLDFIKAYHPPTYERLVTLANTRATEMLGATG